MNPIFEFLISPYENYQTLDIALEATAVILGLLSVYFAKRDQIAVYPSGMISTAIFVYLLFKANLLGDMLINAYFFLVSIYGWYFWQNKKKKKSENPISKMDPFERKWWSLFFILILFFVVGVYNFFDKWNDLSAPVDCFTTALFFLGMWFMARKRIEHWIFLDCRGYYLNPTLFIQRVGPYKYSISYFYPNCYLWIYPVSYTHLRAHETDS